MRAENIRARGDLRMQRSGLILFAHGSREPQWAAPFQETARRVMAALPSVPLRVAYLERMEPDLATAVAQLAAEGVARVVIVPLFLGQGGHLREDLPRLAQAVGQE